MIEVFRAISDQGNVLASKLITYLGVSVGIGGGAAQIVASKNLDNELVQQCIQSTPTWLMYTSIIVPAVAAISLIVKNLADVVFRRIEHKEKMRAIKDERET